MKKFHVVMDSFIFDTYADSTKTLDGLMYFFKDGKTQAIVSVKNLFAVVITDVEPQNL